MNRVKWMSGNFGVMVHYLVPEVWSATGEKMPDSDAAAASFQVDRLLDQVVGAGAEWLMFTFGQNTGYYCSPNAVIEHYAGAGHCTRRDLMYELAVGMRRRGKRFAAYLPAEMQSNPLRSSFGWSAAAAPEQRVFQQRYCEVIRCWAERFGDLLDGWWLDGCWDTPEFEMGRVDWPAWYAALRAGNPHAAVSWNNGAFCVDKLELVAGDEDYFAGETEVLCQGMPRLGRGAEARTMTPDGDCLPGTDCLWHCLVPIDACWAHGVGPGAWMSADHRYLARREISAGTLEAPIYTEAELRRLHRAFCAQGGAVTFNLGILADGSVNPASLEQLRRLA